MKLLISFVLAVGIIVIALVLFRNPSSPQVSPEQDSGDVMTETGERDGDEASVSEPTVREFVIEASNFAFSESSLTVAKGDRVRIVLNIAEGTHNLVLEGYGIGTRTISVGQDVLEFTADQAGTFAFFCSVGNHRQLGMEGRLIVTQ